MEKNEKYIKQKRDYNSKLSTFQISKDLHNSIKIYCKERKLKVRYFLEKIILEEIEKGKNY